MDFTQWMDAKPGRQTRLAEHFGITPSAVNQWRQNGVPRDRILDVHAFTEREVSVEDLLRIPAERASEPQQDAAA